MLYEWLAKEMSFDWQAVFAAWQRRGLQVDELSAEAVAGFQRELLATVDAVTDSSDVAHRQTILRYASGKAIAKLGPAVWDDVIAAA